MQGDVLHTDIFMHISIPCERGFIMKICFCRKHDYKLIWIKTRPNCKLLLVHRQEWVWGMGPLWPTVWEYGRLLQVHVCCRFPAGWGHTLQSHPQDWEAPCNDTLLCLPRQNLEGTWELINKDCVIMKPVIHCILIGIHVLLIVLCTHICFLYFFLHKRPT